MLGPDLGFRSQARCRATGIVQQRAIEIIKGLSQTSKDNLGKLRELVLQPWKEAQWHHISVYKYLKRSCKENRDKLFLVVLSDRTRGNTDKLKHRRAPLNLGEGFIILSTRTQLPAIRLWNLHCWRYSNVIWTGSWAICPRWPYLSRGVETNDLQRSLPTSTILWFCNTVFTNANNVFVHLKTEKIINLIISALWTCQDEPYLPSKVGFN